MEIFRQEDTTRSLTEEPDAVSHSYMADRHVEAQPKRDDSARVFSSSSLSRDESSHLFFAFQTLSIQPSYHFDIHMTQVFIHFDFLFIMLDP